MSFKYNLQKNGLQKFKKSHTKNININLLCSFHHPRKKLKSALTLNFKAQKQFWNLMTDNEVKLPTEGPKLS